MNKFTLADLEQRITDRASAPAELSYTRKLLDKGASQCAKKFGEEAVEAVIAVTGEDRDHVIGEAADVLYHLLVMLHVPRRLARRSRGAARNAHQEIGA